MTATSDFLARQIGLIQAAVGVRFNTGTNTAENADVQMGVANYLDSQGLKDIRDLRYYENAPANLAFFFDVRSGKVFDKADGSNIGYTSAIADPYQGAKSILFYDGRWDSYYIHCSFTPDGYPVFWSLNIKHHNAWAETFAAIASLAAIAVSVAFPALGAYIGSAVMGPELAAAYPLVATGIGNVAIQTTLSGGDIQGAMVGALSGGLGSGVGGFVAGATESAVIGNVAAAATKTAIVGGNIEQAVAGSLLSSGLSSATSLFTAISAPTTGSLGMFDDFGGEIPNVAAPVSYGDALPVSFDPVSGAAPVYDWGWMGAGVDPLATGVYDSTPLSSPDSIDPGGSTLAVNPTAPPPSPSGVIASSGGADLTQLALTALKFVGAWQSAGQPALKASNATTQANANGTMTVRNPNGTTSTVKMPVGTPYLTTTGELVTNNGDGSFTSIDSRGTVSTQRYPATSLATFGSGITIGGMTLSPTVLAVGAVAAILLLRK